MSWNSIAQNKNISLVSIRVIIILYTEEYRTYMHFYAQTKKPIVHKFMYNQWAKQVTIKPCKYIETKNNKPKNAR